LVQALLKPVVKALPASLFKLEAVAVFVIMPLVVWEPVFPVLFFLSVSLPSSCSLSSVYLD